MKRLSAVLALFALIVAGCGGGGGSSPGLPVGSKAGVAAGSATLVIPNSATTPSSNGRRPQFIAASAASVKISVPTLADQIFSIAAGSTSCTTANSARTCTLAFTATAGQPAITVTLYDGANATGNVLGSATAIPSVTAGVPFTVSLTIGGTIKTVTINLSSSFTMGTPGTATVMVTAVDADGNAITGPANFSQPVTLVNSDTSGAFTLSSTTINSPTGSATLTYNGSSTVSGSTMINASVPLSGVQVNSASVFGTNSSPAPVSCGTALPLLGTYTTVISFGTYSGTTYTAAVPTPTPQSVWIKFAYSIGTPTPVPSPTTTPTPGPSPSPTGTPAQPIYVFEGTYQLLSGSSGCVYMITSQDGSVFTAYAGTSDAFASGLTNMLPNVYYNTSNPVNSTFVSSGYVSSLIINNLGPSTGNGTINLDNGDSGTVSLAVRYAATFDTVRRLIEQQHRN